MTIWACWAICKKKKKKEWCSFTLSSNDSYCIHDLMVCIVICFLERSLSDKPDEWKHIAIACISYVLWWKADEERAAGGQLSSTSCQCHLTVLFFSPGERGAELCRLRHQQPLLHLGLIFPQSLCFSLTCPSFFSSQFASDSFLSVVKLLVSTSIRHSHFFVLVNSHDNNLLDKRAVKFVNGLMLKVWMCF